jgi:DNA-binding CsgD family transcriptional regulator
MKAAYFAMPRCRVDPACLADDGHPDAERALWGKALLSLHCLDKSGRPAFMNDRMHRIQSLWDELADFPVAHSDEAFAWLLGALCDMLDAWNAGWIAAIRMNVANGTDPIGGWRPREAGYLHQTEDIEAARREQYERLASGETDPTIPRNVAGAGQWRARRWRDLIGPEWFESDYYQRYFQATDRADAIWLGCPVNPDLEIYIGVFRRVGQDWFDEADCCRALEMVRGLKWFFRRHLLSHGLMVAEGPLTKVEREILMALLAGKTRNQIAEISGRSPHTVHHHCKSLYQKFGVNSQASLMALWLGRPMSRE